MPDRYNIIGWTLIGAAFLVLAVLYVLLFGAFPLVIGLLTSHALVALVAVWVSGRNLRAELEAVRERLSAYNGSSTHEDLADVRSGEFEVPGFMADSGYRPPGNEVELFDGPRLAEMRTYTRDEIIAEHGFTQAEIDAADDVTDHLGQACGWSDDGLDQCGDPAVTVRRLADGTPVPLCAGHDPWAAGDEPEHLGQACEYPECGIPATAWVTWDTGKREFLCAGHHDLVMGDESTTEFVTDDDPATFPRSLPGRID